MIEDSLSEHNHVCHDQEQHNDEQGQGGHNPNYQGTSGLSEFRDIYFSSTLQVWLNELQRESDPDPAVIFFTVNDRSGKLLN